ncbi:MAG: 50S ribosomal protein L22 [Bdellovibrio sp.]|nr:50S ribosomal protein L22 [Bdellovibrio sp.]
MEVNAIVRSVRITPRKMGLLADEVRGKNINEALTYLQFSPRKRTAYVLSNLLKSAVANADQKGTVDVDTLFVKTILVGQGTTLKRFRPRAKGSAFRINKKTSHVSVTLSER